MKMTLEEVRNQYNIFVQGQREILGKDPDCEYYPIEPWFFELLSQDETTSLETFINKITNNWEQAFWANFVRDKKQLYHRKLKKKRKLKTLRFKLAPHRERIDSNAFKRTQLHLGRDFLSLAEQRGIYVHGDNLWWYLENELIRPVYVRNRKPYFSVSQVYELDVLHSMKLRSIECAETMSLPDRTTYKAPIDWQEYLLLNRPVILRDCDFHEIELMHELFLYIDDYFSRAFYMTAKNHTGPVQNSKYQETISLYQEDIIEKIFSSMVIRDGLVEYWMNIMVDRALLHNPLLGNVDSLPSMIRFFQKPAKQRASLHKRINNFALANFYYIQTRKLLFVFNGISGRNVTLEDIFDRQSITPSSEKMRICANPECQVAFVPKKTGRKQTTCDKSECKKFLTKQRDEKRNKKDKLKRQRKN